MRSVRISLEPKIAPGQRIAAIDELKGLAIALIIFYHAGGVLNDHNPIHGEIGVDIFLILSGFTLAVNSATMPLGRFFTRRFFRIYPSYWTALALFLWMSKRYYGVNRSWDNIIEHIVGVHGYSRLVYFSDISDPFWFISMIVAAYLVFACLRSRLGDLSLVIAVGAALTLIATVTYIHFTHVGGLISLAVRIPSFFAGVIMGRLFSGSPGEIRFNLILGLGLMCFYVQTFFFATTNNYTLPALGIVAAWLGLRHYLVKVLPGRLFLGAFALTGILSYEIYLFHQPFIRDYNDYFLHHVMLLGQPTDHQKLTGIFVGLGITLVIAVVVHFTIGRAYRVFEALGRRRSRA